MCVYASCISHIARSRFILVTDTAPQKRYYEVWFGHSRCASLRSNFSRNFQKGYAVLGKQKTQRKYDQYEQLYSALIMGLRHQRAGELASSEPRPVDPTFWDPVKSGSSMFYRPPAGYWSVMNKLMRDRELKEREKTKLQAQAVSFPGQKAMPSHDGPEENETDSEVRLSEFQRKLIIVAFSAVFAVVFVDRVKKLLGYTRLQASQENNESDS
ncbi:hypothetical protein EV424DRAFT_1373434 [Suillus variegatus]|nr:hypothetical protein EV424DRAFT_1373434 [Suillus variegatus]